MKDCGAEILDLIGKARPHVVALDYRLSGEACIQVCREIIKRYPHLPALALSCNSNIHEVYSQFGFDGYLEKLFDLDRLYFILRKHIHKPADGVAEPSDALRMLPIASSSKAM